MTKAKSAKPPGAHYPAKQSAAAVAVHRGFDLVEGFLSRLACPAIEVIGEALERKAIQTFRGKNFQAEIAGAEQKLLDAGGNEGAKIHPRMLFQAYEHGSWVDDAEVQDLWAGLLASSCTPDGTDDSNLMFTTLLSQMSVAQAKIVKFGVENCGKHQIRNSCATFPLRVPAQKLVEVTGVDDLHRLDRELDQLCAFGLFSATGRTVDYVTSFSYDLTEVNLVLTSVALHFYLRCMGIRQSPLEYFELIDTSKWQARPAEWS